MWWRSRLLRVIFSLVLLALRTYQLQSYERQVLLQLRKHLEYPIQLDVWLNYNGDLCNLSSTARTSIACQGNSVTELKIMGDKLAKFSEFNGFALPNQTLSESLSMDSFVTTLTRLTNLRVLSLVSLGIWGPLPDKIHRLYSLELLDMSLNFMFGTIPSQISRMVSLHTLTLDGNFFNDTMPDWLCSLANLTVLSLRDNRKRHTRCAPPDLHTLPKVVQDNPPSAISSELLANARIISHAAKLGTQGTLVYRLFTMEELEEATKHFDPSMLLGDGSIGKIYKGRLENGSYVAIRSLSLHKKFLIRNLKLRLDLLSKFCHPHLVCLLGHCIDGGVQDDSTVNRVFLVYEFVPDGNFHARLSETCPEKFLKWSDRLAVLIGVAKAVHFLHTGVIPPSACNRLKTKNILLDEHRVAKLSDYGMSILTEEVEKSEAKGDVSKSWHMTKSEDDVYNFGFILLESLVGSIARGKGEAFLLNEMASFGSRDGRRKIVDPIVLTTSSQESLSIVISITNKCLSPESSRPSFEDVLWNLQYAAQVQATADADQKSDAALLS